jgi:hypothetical protein
MLPITNTAAVPAIHGEPIATKPKTIFNTPNIVRQPRPGTFTFSTTEVSISLISNYPFYVLTYLSNTTG